MLKDLLKLDDWLTKVHLKDAYFMMPVSTNHRKLLQLKWLGETYQFSCLPFGLSSALQFLIADCSHPQDNGAEMLIYIDNILILTETECLSREQTAGLIFLLENLGFIINWASSSTTQNPFSNHQKIKFIVDSTTMAIKMPGWKKMEIRKLKTWALLKP